MIPGKQHAALDDGKPVHIIRYGNRKLYVPNLGYVELPFLQECVRRNVQVTVRNHTSGEDETGLIFSRMLVDAAKQGKAPVAEVRQMLQGIYAQPASTG